jgi:hypothetical protein
VYDALALTYKCMTLRASSAGRSCFCKHAFSCRPNPCTTVCLVTHTHSLSLAFSRARALFPSLPPLLFLFLSLSHRHTHTYASVCWRMVAYGRVGAVWRCEARHGSVSLSDYRLLQYISPPLHSYRFLGITYRLRRTDIAFLISDIGSHR